MWYRHFLAGVHEALVPPTYLEIGINRGGTLGLSRASTIAIDPDFQLEHDVPPGATLHRETSDAYFARETALDTFGGEPVSLALVDGMHLAEYALRDFVNVERHVGWTSAIVIDDVIPRRPEQAARERSTKAWTGDVYKLLRILERHRPDLICLRVDTDPAGLLLVLAPDPESRVLSEHYEAIAGEVVAPDPQDVPSDVLERRGALDPAAVLAASFWSVLREGREHGVPREEGLARLRRAVERDFAPSPSRRLRGLLPSRG